MVSLDSFWQSFNANEGSLQLLIPLVFWPSCFLYSHLIRGENTFHKWSSIHLFHQCSGLLLAALSIYFQNDSIFSEKIPTLYSLVYFHVDLLDCLI